MHLANSFTNSLQSIYSHKLRSTLTLLGIMIGVAAVVTMFASVYGIKKIVSDNMKGMGWNNSLIIHPSEASSRRRRKRFWHMRRSARPFDYEDYVAVQRKAGAKYAYGMIDRWDRYIYGLQKDWVNMYATNVDFFAAKTYPLKTGRFFNHFEEKTAAKVCVIGYYFAEKYFINENPLGKTITVGANRYTIIGVLDKDKLNDGAFDFNPWERRHELSSVFIPLSTGSVYINADRKIDYIYTQAFTREDYATLKNRVNQIMLVEHGMSHDFAFQDIGAEMLKTSEEIDKFMKKWNITLSAIASVSLLVGGIGLFSTLLISINEKMMEIGIRKSLGATEKDIFAYFLIESITLATIGAVTGILFSNLLVQIIAMAVKKSFPVPLEGIGIGLGFALVIGLLSGFYPAHKASRIDPIRAIFYFE